MGGAEEGMLAGQTADLAGQVRVACQVLIPELRMALATDAIKAMTAAVGEYRAEGLLAGRRAQQQRFGSGGVALQIDQGGADHVLAQVAGGNTHKTLVKGGRRGRGAWQLFERDMAKAPPAAGLAACFEV